mgnify:CR=1 FL=1
MKVRGPLTTHLHRKCSEVDISQLLARLRAAPSHSSNLAC